jgi:uncharacterized membrane protein
VDGWWWHMSGMWIFWIVLTILAVFWIRWLPRSTTGREPSRESPIEILKRREKEEYERTLADLRR